MNLRRFRSSPLFSYPYVDRSIDIFNEAADLINRTLYIACVLNELELFFLFSFYDKFTLRELSEYSASRL